MQTAARRQSNMRISFCRRPSQLFARKNIFHTLRVQDPDVYNRHVWEDNDGPPNVEQNENGDGGTVPFTSAIVRFGTRQEIALHHSMRVVAICDVFIVPFVASFDWIYPLRDLPALFVLDFILTVLFACGLALRFRTSYITDHGEEGKKIADIVKTTYNSATFWVDVAALAAAPFLHVRGPLGLLCLVRLLKAWRIPQAVYRMVLLNPPEYQVWRLLCDVLTGFFMIEHIYACAWFCAKMNSPVGFGHEWSVWNGWTDRNELEFAQEAVGIAESVSLEQLMQFYLYALRDGGYMLAGWGGVVTLSAPELVLICILAPLSTCLISFVSGLFVSAVGAAMIKQEQYLIKSASLNAACLDLKLPDELRHRICKYQSYVHIHNMDPESRDLFVHLSDNLVGEVRVHRLTKVIEESSFFQHMTAYQILSVLGMMDEKVYAPGDFICRKDDPADTMYIIERGHVGISTNEYDDCFRYMYKGEMVGVAALLRNDAVRTAFVRAETFTVLMTLPRTEFQAYLDADPDLKGKIKRSIEGDTNRFTQTHRKFTISSTASIFSRMQNSTMSMEEEEEVEDDGEGAESGSDSGLASIPEVDELDDCIVIAEAEERAAAEAAAEAKRGEEEDDNESTPLMSARRTPQISECGSARSDRSLMAGKLEALERQMFGGRISAGASRTSEKARHEKVKSGLKHTENAAETGLQQQLDRQTSPSTQEVQEVAPVKYLSPRMSVANHRSPRISVAANYRSPRVTIIPPDDEDHKESKPPGKSDQQEIKSQSKSDHQETKVQTVYEQLLEFREESRLCREAWDQKFEEIKCAQQELASRGAAWEEHLKEIRCAQEKIASREEAWEQRLKDISDAQLKITSMLQRVDSLQGSCHAGGSDAVIDS